MSTKTMTSSGRTSALRPKPSSTSKTSTSAQSSNPEKDAPARVGLRLSPEAKQMVEQAALLLGMTVNAFATAQVVQRSQEILRESRGLVFDEKAKMRFLAMLDDQDGPNDALKAAAERYDKEGRVSGDRYIFDL